MAVSVPAEAIAAMEQSNTGEVLVTSFYGATQTIPSAQFPGVDRVPITTDGSITFDADGTTQANGTLNLALDGGSMVPQSKTDALAPFGQELSLVRRVHYADTFWDIPLGRFRIEEVPDTAEFLKAWPGVPVGWSAQLNITDLFDKIISDAYLRQQGPTPGNSAWDEIQLLSVLPIVKSLTDQPVPAGITYQNRMDGIVQMMNVLGGEPHLTRQGQLTARPKNTWLTATDPVAVVNGAVKTSGGMSNQLKNYVAVTNPNDPNIFGEWSITDESNPLAITRPIGRRTQELSDPLMDTQTKATAAAATAGARLSTQQSRIVKVSCLPRWDLELGDFIQVNDKNTGDVWLGEMRHCEFPTDPTALMTFDLTVSEKR